MTDRLYYTDPYLTAFDAAVVDAVRTGDGRSAVVLDRTAFYPSSGGQPYDIGTLGTARVVDVIDGDDGRILHVIEGQAPAGRVEGRVDWARRFDHMQQHTGQHVLSAAFDRILSAATVSFHLGSASATIDLAREVTPAEIARAETEANRIVWEDRPVAIKFVDTAEAARLPLRKEPARSGTLRLIDVEDFDLSACGGTHVARTAAIGIIAVGAWERLRGASRIEFLCGSRALARFRMLRDSMAAAARHLSVLPADLPAALERIQADEREQRRRVKDLQSRVAVHEAAALAEGAVATGGLHLVAAVLDGWDPVGLRAVASAIVARPGHLAVLLGSPAPLSLVVQRAADVELDCAALLKGMTGAFGGKGGGKADLAQGGGLQGAPADILAHARAAVAGGATASGA